MADLFKEVIPSIMLTKKHVLLTTEDEKSYQSFLVNKALSFHKDCILLANIINIESHLDSKLKYDFLFHTIRGYRRQFVPWMKKGSSESLELVKQHFGYSTSKAQEALEILTEEQLEEIREESEVGGVHK